MLTNSNLEGRSEIDGGYELQGYMGSGLQQHATTQLIGQHTVAGGGWLNHWSSRISPSMCADWSPSQSSSPCPRHLHLSEHHYMGTSLVNGVKHVHQKVRPVQYTASKTDWRHIQCLLSQSWTLGAINTKEIVYMQAFGGVPAPATIISAPL